MKKKLPSLILRFGLLLFSLFLIGIGVNAYLYNDIYQNIEIEAIQNRTIEYGSSYNVKDLIKEAGGKIVSIENDVDTSKVGVQQVVFAVKKDKVIKNIPVSVKVKDTVAPKVEVKEEEITITEGDSYNLLDNMNSVKDSVSGDIQYLSSEEIKEDSLNYYTISGDFDNNTPGNYTVTVKAVDNNGNVTTKDYKINVEEKPKPVVSMREEVSQNYNNGFTGTVDTSSIVAAAYSLLGARYVSGGNSPETGFDCSGFVQYVYSVVGKNISRSSSTQAYDGVLVSYDAAQPGDILNWGYGPGRITHSALYVGNGMMIHAANWSTGVILSNVAGWTRGSGTYVVSVRRV